MTKDAALPTQGTRNDDPTSTPLNGVHNIYNIYALRGRRAQRCHARAKESPVLDSSN